jgi:U4/U6.U5 tri-snRNP-associated protein 2
MRIIIICILFLYAIYQLKVSRIVFVGESVSTLVSESKVRFLYLSMELPAMPLFSENQQFDQIPLFQLLSKFDAQTSEILPDGNRKTFQISKLPHYLLLHYKRFKNNQWFIEKNHTLVNFPLKNLDMKPYVVAAKPPTVDELELLSVAALKKKCSEHKLDSSSCSEKSDLVDLLAEFYERAEIPYKCNLIANICHEGKPKDGTYRVHTNHKASNTWYEMEDIHVWTSETMAQLVALSETYMQCFALQQPDLQ